MDPVWKGFVTDPETGRLYFYGWAVFGHILPRVWVDAFPCYRDGDTAMCIEDGGESDACPFLRKCLVTEWFGLGYVWPLRDSQPYPKPGVF